MKEEAAAGLTAFSDALRAASGELSGKQLGFAGDMVQQAADGLESFARAIEGRSPGEMLDGLRSFGRQNPVGFIAGLGARRLRPRAACRRGAGGGGLELLRRHGRAGAAQHADRRLRRRVLGTGPVEGAGL